MNFKELREKCQENSDLSDPILTDIMYYGAHKNNLDERFDRYSLKYTHIVSKWDKTNWNKFKSQFIIHEIFKQNGLIFSYLNQDFTKNLSLSALNHLYALARSAWRYTFWELIDSPSTDFFTVRDIVNDSKVLLYSPGVSAYLKTNPPKFFGGLVHTFEECYQTFGPIVAYFGMDEDDIFYFTGEINTDPTESDDTEEIISKNLFPFLLLAAFSHLPIQKAKGNELVWIKSEGSLASFDMDLFKAKFKIQYNPPVFKLDLKKYSEYPHFAEAFFHEENKSFSLSAMTELGYEHLLETFNSLGLNIKPYPMIRIHLAMQLAMEEILKSKVELNPYKKLFKKTDSKSSDDLEKLHDFLHRLLPLLNSNQRIDLDRLLSESGAEPKAARSILEQLQKNLNL